MYAAEGGATCNTGSSQTYNDCRFIANSASGNEYFDELTWYECANQTLLDRGGAMSVGSGKTLNVFNCTFDSNTGMSGNYDWFCCSSSCCGVDGVVVLVAIVVNTLAYSIFVAANQGGAFILKSSGDVLLLSHSVLTNNFASCTFPHKRVIAVLQYWILIEFFQTLAELFTQ